MLKEINLFGVYLPPVVFYLTAAALVWLALRWLLKKTGAYRHIWHIPLFNTALYVVLFATIYLYLNRHV